MKNVTLSVNSRRGRVFSLIFENRGDDNGFVGLKYVCVRAIITIIGIKISQ